jgi:membrane protein CcdC involved in cytochrome C biogenesis
MILQVAFVLVITFLKGVAMLNNMSLMVQRMKESQRKMHVQDISLHSFICAALSCMVLGHVLKLAICKTLQAFRIMVGCGPVNCLVSLCYVDVRPAEVKIH